MNKKKVLINAAIIILVPTVISASWYGYKAYKHYRDKKQKEKAEEENNAKTETEENNKKEIEKEKAPIEGVREAKIIPLYKQIEDKETKIAL